jgi:hypothetical protein
MSIFLNDQLNSVSLAEALIRPTGFAVLVACCLMTPMSGQAQPQLQSIEPQAQPQVPPLAEQPPAEQSPAEQAPPSHRPGFFDALGRWFGDSRAVIDSQVKTTQDAIGAIGSRATDAAKDAAGTVVAVPGTRIVSGRQICPPAPNGAPDCQRGVEALCQTKGFQAGRTLDISSSQRCPAKVWMSGRAPKEGDCRLETYVVRAVCQ